MKGPQNKALSQGSAHGSESQDRDSQAILDAYTAEFGVATVRLSSSGTTGIMKKRPRLAY